MRTLAGVLDVLFGNWRWLLLRGVQLAPAARWARLCARRHGGEANLGV